jgi:hypothetical protein
MAASRSRQPAVAHASKIVFHGDDLDRIVDVAARVFMTLVLVIDMLPEMKETYKPRPPCTIND